MQCKLGHFLVFRLSWQLIVISKTNVLQIRKKRLTFTVDLLSGSCIQFLDTVKSIIQPAGYKGFRGFWGRAIVKGACYLLSKFTKKRNFSRKNSKCGLYSRAGCIIGFTVCRRIFLIWFTSLTHMNTCLLQQALSVLIIE